MPTGCRLGGVGVFATAAAQCRSSMNGNTQTAPTSASHRSARLNLAAKHRVTLVARNTLWEAEARQLGGVERCGRATQQRAQHPAGDVWHLACPSR